VGDDQSAELFNFPLVVGQPNQIPGRGAGYATAAIGLTYPVPDFSRSPFQIDLAQIGAGDNFAGLVDDYTAVKFALLAGKQVRADMVVHHGGGKKIIGARSDKLFKPDAIFQFKFQQIINVAERQIANMHSRKLFFIYFYRTLPSRDSELFGA